LGLGNEESTLKTSRAYVAGLGTTGVLIGSFFLLLTVGSTLVAFRGVPGAASNGDLSSIELRQQREAAAQRSAGLLAASNVLDDATQGSREGGAAGDVFGQLASAGRANPAGNIRQGTSGRSGPGALRPVNPGAPLGEKAPSTNPPASPPASGVVQTPVDPGALADDGSGSSGDTGSGSGSGTDSGSSTDSGSGSGSDPGSTGGSTGSSDPPATDPGSGTSGGATPTVGDTVGDATGSVGTVVGPVSPAAGSTVTDTGTAAGGLLDDATSVVEGLTGGLGS
jgi:hypothetical protein